jgi:hypothetical protein
MRKISAILLLISAAALLSVMTGCSKKARYGVVGKWTAAITYSSDKKFTPNWQFKKDGTFYEFGGEAWGTFTVKDDQIKITRNNKKEYYSGTVDSKTHMSGKFFYVGYEDKQTITWEAVKIDE